MASGTTMLFGSWMWLLLLGGAAGVPLGGAPLPPDPVLSAVAPPDCLWFIGYAGVGPADPNSDNQTEQLFAEPQVQRFAAEVEKQVMRAIRQAAGGGREQRVLVSEIPTLVKALFSRPSAFYIEDVRPRDGGVDVEAAFLLNAGNMREAVQQSLARLLELRPDGEPRMVEETVAGVVWQRLETPPQAPTVRWGWREDYLIIAVGDPTPEKIASRVSGEPPAWLVDLRREHPIEREASVGYLNVAGVVERARPLLGGHEQWSIAEQLGMNNLSAIHAVSGYDEVGFTNIAHFATDGSRRGVLSLLPYKPLSKRDLRTIPKDPLTAVACRLDPAELFDAAMRLASEFDPDAESEVEDALWNLETQLGVNVRGDLVGALDDVWIAYLPGGDLMSSWVGAAAAVKVKDRQTLEDSVAKLVAEARSQAARSDDVEIRESDVDGRKIYSLAFTREPVPISPSWCVGDQWLVFGLMPQAVRDVLDRSEDQSLADVPEVQAVLAEADGPAVIAYQDTPRLVRSVYPWVQLGGQMLAAGLRKEGFDIDMTALPSAESIVKHLRPAVSTVTHRRDGFYCVTRQSLPGGGNFAAAVPIGAGLLIPAITQARFAARSAGDQNNLRQITLAFHNYEAANGRFPTDVYSEDGKPLLSWRVQLLPYLESPQLFDQIRMDEPWDSEHNRQIAARMPDVYRSSTGDGRPGTTRFVALAGEKTLHPGNRRLGFRDVTDGTSNTLLYVQANQEAAVDWMKPADLQYNPQKPLAGLQNEFGHFLGSMCDGRTRKFSLQMPADTMNSLVTPAGGEIVDWDTVENP